MIILILYFEQIWWNIRKLSSTNIENNNHNKSWNTKNSLNKFSRNIKSCFRTGSQ